MVWVSSPATEAVGGAEGFAFAWADDRCAGKERIATANNGDRNMDFMVLPFRNQTEWRILALFIISSQGINDPLMTKVASVGNRFHCLVEIVTR
jgi:hypothetical protein